MRTLNGGQRVVLCVAGGAALVVLGFAVRAWFFESAEAGWFNYAPNNGVIYSAADPDRVAIAVQAVVWWALVALWAAVSLVLLRDRRPPGDGTRPA